MTAGHFINIPVLLTILDDVNLCQGRYEPSYQGRRDRHRTLEKTFTSLIQQVSEKFFCNIS